MGFERLEILRFSQNGEVLRRLVCLAGRVSVFRSRMQNNLTLYRDAICGKPTSARFSLLLDGSTFQPGDHNYIGFGESFSRENCPSVREYLTEAGLSREDLEPTLANFGLGGLASASSADLSPAQQTMLRMLAASCMPNKLLICNNPFQHLPEPWHDSLAQRLTNFAWRKRAIVVVTELTVRPETWIENEFIARLSLEPPRKATIGFGGSESMSADLVANIRRQVKEFDESNAPAKSQQVPLANSGSTEPSKAQAGALRSIKDFFISALSKRGRAQYRLAGLIIVTFLMAAEVVILTSGPSRPDPGPAPEPTKLASVNVSHSPQRNSDEPSSVIDAYPAGVKEAVLRAFNSPEDVIRARAEAASRRSAAIRKKEQAAQPTPQVVYQPPPRPTPQSVETEAPDLSEEEARRRERRKAFLEAIRRSRDEELTDDEREEREARRERLLEALRRHRAFRDAQ